MVKTTNGRAREKYGIRTLWPRDFPELLGELPDPPDLLHLRGELPSPALRQLCVVGSRRFTPYGRNACQKLIAGLAGHPIAIISGLALGIDGIAHQAALDAGLQTLGVLGSGVTDQAIYPITNRPLAKKILAAGGGIMSEFPPDMHPAPWCFPQRNRIMAGMSHATLVIEAGEKSGTLITARLALDYNRDVLAVPGSIFSESSGGCHGLLRRGAVPVTSSEDILEALGIEVPDERSPTQQALALEGCSEDEKSVLELLRAPLSRDELIRDSGLSAARVSIALSGLELRGLIDESLGEIRRH